MRYKDEDDVEYQEAVCIKVRYNKEEEKKVL